MLYKTKYGLDVSVELIRERDRVEVKIISPLYMHKEWLMPHCYSLEFSDYQILNDSYFNRVMINHFPK